MSLGHNINIPIFMNICLFVWFNNAFDDLMITFFFTLLPPYWGARSRITAQG
jgi:hypothetical protein